MGKLILGIDDAGRGPVIGPMALAGCLIREEIEGELKRLGVRDSKQLTRKRRLFLETTIKEKAEAFFVHVTQASEIDHKLAHGTNLNSVEAEMAAKIINEINKNIKEKIKVVIDCPSINKSSWREELLTKIDNLSNLEILCEHKADRDYVAVSAASILAKEEREREMDILKQKYGDDLGSGYATDPKTQKFLQKNLKKLENKGIFRKSWKTWQNANQDSNQKKLF